MVRTADAVELGNDEVLPVGSRAGPWIVEHELGHGGMGTVYAVVHDEIAKRAALKVLHGRLLAAGFNADRMLLEARVVNQVDHPNIVDIFETGRLADGRPYIVMERLEGESLGTRASAGKIQPDQVIGILLQIADALIAAHATGIVHRDLKLDNIFLIGNPDDPDAPSVKVLDWGIAKDLVHEVRLTAEGTLVGTPLYLSPEQVSGKPVSTQTDVYALGVMAYELFLEEPPFQAETAAEVMTMHLRARPTPAHELWPEIPRSLEALLHAMLEKSPDRRPTMSAVWHALEALRAIRAGRHAPTVAATDIVSSNPATRSWKQRWRWGVEAPVILAAAAMLFAADDAPRSEDLQLAPPVAEWLTGTPRSTTTTRVDVAAPQPVIRAVPLATHRKPRGVQRVRVTVEPAPIDPNGTLEPYP